MPKLVRSRSDQGAGLPVAECSLNLLPRETGFAADGGLDVRSERTTVTGRYSDSRGGPRARRNTP